MKLLRFSVPLLAFTMAAALAACGGGGGGGGTPPVQNPGGGPPPATNPPATNPPATNPPATNPPATNPPATPPPPVGVSSTIIRAEDHVLNGTDNWQSAGSGDGDTATGGQGPIGGGTIDGQYNCVIGQEPAASPVTYHVHAFVGIMVNGKEMAMPDGVGIVGADSNEPILTFQCAYNIHTHGASGIIHMEDPSLSGTWNSKPATAAPAKYNLQALLDIWGQSATGLAGGSGLPAVYVGDIDGTKNPATNDDLVNKFTLSTAPLSTILLQHHRAIWLVYGTPPAAGLPQVDFGVSD